MQQLRKYWKVFNGRKLLAISKDERTESSDTVLRELGTSDYEVMLTDNDPNLGETKSFVEGLSRLQSLDPAESTFYAHAKGVSRGQQLLPNIIAWCEAMYLMNLGSPELIDKLLERFDAVGGFHLVPIGSPWHFGGTFFWFNHAALFSARWSEIAKTRHGVESFIGTHIPLEKACPLAPLGEYEDLYMVKLPIERCQAWMRDWIARELGSSPKTYYSVPSVADTWNMKERANP
jgi:hypothetical protein